MFDQVEGGCEGCANVIEEIEFGNVISATCRTCYKQHHAEKQTLLEYMEMQED